MPGSGRRGRERENVYAGAQEQFSQNNRWPGSALAWPSISLSKYLGGGEAPRAPVHPGPGGRCSCADPHPSGCPSSRGMGLSSPWPFQEPPPLCPTGAGDFRCPLASESPPTLGALAPQEGPEEGELPCFGPCCRACTQEMGCGLVVTRLVLWAWVSGGESQGHPENPGLSPVPVPK